MSLDEAREQYWWEKALHQRGECDEFCYWCAKEEPMLKFLDGPAAGRLLPCTRAPLFLRVTHAGDDPASGWDALDQLNDHPNDGETIHVYRKHDDHGTVHYHGRDKRGRRFGRWEQMADYRFYPDQPDDATLRDTIRWRQWALTQQAAEIEAQPITVSPPPTQE